MIALLDRLLRAFPCFGEHTICGPSGPYLLRKYLLPKRHTGAWWPGVFLHKFYRSDEDRSPHNHPWQFAVSLILTGGYREWRFDRASQTFRAYVRRPLSFNVIRAEDFHRADLLDPHAGCWTLFIAFGHKPAEAGEEWGFVDPETDVFTGWREYLAKGANGLEGD
jgi:hypothetical protein